MTIGATARRNELVLVLGMHRSGTSAVTRALNILGAEVPDNVVGPSEHNPSGYWEGRDFIALHDEILTAANTAWDDWSPVPADWFATPDALALQSRLAELIDEKYPQGRLLIAKDPRMCRLVPLWRGALEQLSLKGKAVVVLRNPVEVAASLEARNGMDAGKAYLLWLRYTLDSVQKSTDFPRCFVNYHTLMSDWRPAVDRIAEALGITWPVSKIEAGPSLDDHFNQSFRHHHFEGVIADQPQVTNWVIDAYEAVRQLETDPANLDALEKLASIGDAFETGTKAFSTIAQGWVAERSEYRDEINRRKSLVVRMREQIEGSEARVGQLEEAVQVLVKHGSDLAQLTQTTIVAQKTAHSDAINAYKEQQKAAQSEARLYRKQLKAAQERVEKLSIEKAESLQKSKLLSSSIKTMEKKLKDRDRQHFKEMQKIVQESERRIASYKKDAENLNDKIEEINTIISNERIEFSDRISKITLEKDSLLESSIRVQADLNEKLGQLESELADQKARYEADVSVQARNLNATQVRLQEISEALNQAVEDRAVWQRQSADAAHEVSRLNAQLTEVQSDLQMWEATFVDNARRLTRLLASRSSGTRTMNVSGRHAHEVRKLVLAIEAMIADTQAELDNQRLQLDAMERVAGQHNYGTGRFSHRMLATSVAHALKLRKPLPKWASMTPDIDEAVSALSVSGLFDPELYLEKNPDVAAAGVDPARHYLEVGWREQRVAAPVFDAKWYSRQLSGEARQSIPEIGHYLLFGYRDGWTPHPLFDPLFYRRQSNIPSEVEPFGHYLTEGWRKGFNPHPLFNGEHYSRTALGGTDPDECPLLHFLSGPSHQKGSPHPLFDHSWYARQSGVGADDPAVGLIHHLTSPVGAAISPHPLFEPAFYLARYADIAKVGVHPLAHYVVSGEAEGRDPHWLVGAGWVSLHTPGAQDGSRLAALAQQSTGPTLQLCDDFDTKSYAAYLDKHLVSGIQPLIHFLTRGYHRRASILRLRKPDVFAKPSRPGRDLLVDFLTAKYGLESDLSRQAFYKSLLAAADRSSPIAPVESRPVVKSSVAGDRLELPTASVRGKKYLNLNNKPKINWIMMPDNLGWAYGNNANRLASRLPEFDHVFDSRDDDCDIAFYFDIKIFKRVGPLGRHRVLRVGGPRPVELTYNGDQFALEQDLAAFDLVIVLNEALYEWLSPLHPHVVLVPNALDVDAWAPVSRVDEGNSDFVVGFSGNISTSKEREIKGLDILIEACARLELPLHSTQKGSEQIPNNEMRDRFFAQIDCLVHPVGEGKEGCSNVIMEAAAAGVPVVTTPYAGFHAERMKDGESIIISERSVEGVAKAIELLKSDAKLRRKVSTNARLFAERHHDLNVVGAQYRGLLHAIPQRRKRLSIAFIPFWQPAKMFASSRLRCEKPARLLAEHHDVGTEINANTQIVFVSQLCTDDVMTTLEANPSIYVIYDICDRYFDDEREVGGVHARRRFFELAARADLIVASSVSLKRELCNLGLATPVTCIPDGIDFEEEARLTPSMANGPLVWFGNAGRGNFDSARWMIDHAIDTLNLPVKLISRARTFAHLAHQHPDDPRYALYAQRCVDWAPETFIDELTGCSLCVLAHSPDEPSKSPNRLITAAMNGVPCLVSTSPSCEALLCKAGLAWAIVSSPEEMDRAIERLSDPQERSAYLRALQDEIRKEFGEGALQKRYQDLINRYYVPPQAPLPRVLFVSHNLQEGEGAPTSLLQTVTGLRDRYGITPLVFAVTGGGLQRQYAAAGIEVVRSKQAGQTRTVTKPLIRDYAQMRSEFAAVVSQFKPDVVISNTAKCLCYSDMARELGVPAITMIRESSEEHIDLKFCEGEYAHATRRALIDPSPTVFVSGYTARLWRKHHPLADCRLIPNSVAAGSAALSAHRTRDDICKELGVDPGVLLMVCVGTINERKSQLDLVNAFAGLDHEDRERARLVLVGARPNAYLAQLKARVEALDSDIGQRIHIVGETDDIGSWYAAADLFVFASTNESYPRVIIEAMMAGLPIISTAVFGTQEQIVHGESGLLVPVGDTEAMRDQMAACLRDDALRMRLGEGAAARAWDLTTPAEMLAAYHALIVQHSANGQQDGE